LLQRFEQKIQTNQEFFSQGSLFSNESVSVKVTNSVNSQAGIQSIQSVPHDYRLVSTDEKRKELIRELEQVSEFCFDTETTSLELHDLELVGISFCFESNRAFYLSLPPAFNECLQVVKELKHVFENEKITKTGQNLKFDILALRRYGIEVKGELFDTMLAHYLLEPDMRHNLNYLAEVYLNYSPIPIETLLGKKGRDQRSMGDLDPETVKDYAAEDADIAWQLSLVLRKELDKQGLSDLSVKIEMPLIYVLADMEWSGIRVDDKILHAYARELNQEAQNVEKEIHQLAGIEFNLQSPKQLGEVLFDKLQIIKNPSRTKTKQYSTSEEVLEKISDKHPIIEKILEYRGLKKLISTYVEALPRLIHPKTGKVHTSFNQAIASTGRLSSTNPNLQNIPIREERGREIRKAFVPTSPAHLLLSADYSQIELRLMAHMSMDTSMIEAFRNNEDIHTATAAKIHHVLVPEVTREMRAQAKTANFGIIYGISAYGLSHRLNISREEAKKLIDGYFSTYPGVKNYMESSIAMARENGFVETIMGRKRPLPDINSKNAVVRGMAERNAINAPIQGSAADIVKLAMINIRNRFRKESIQSRLVLQVHDELVFDALKSELEAVQRIVKEEMEQAVRLRVPLVIESGIGDNWLEAH
jgi:DNA polymerase I